jgi:late competence protein required for DNA uptake (superfamily II DNA/RNA helicase)
VVGVAGANPRLKSDWIEKHIKKGYTDIFFIDDSPKNIRAVSMLKRKYPNTRIVTKLAK